MPAPSTGAVDIRLDGQVAVVTGGGRGLGRAVAQGLAAAGMATAVVARSADQLAETVALIDEAGGHAVAIPADVTEWRAVEHAFAEVERRLGPVDLLASIAGAYGNAGPAWETDPEEWWAVVDTNLRGRFLSARAALPGMVARRRGRIVNMASAAGTFPGPYVSAYHSAYAAVLRLTDSLAAEVKDLGIGAFAISPGITSTPAAERCAQAWKPWVPVIADALASDRTSPAAATARLVVWIASGRADALSGRLLSVTQAYDAMASRAEEIRAHDLYVLRLREESTS